MLLHVLGNGRKEEFREVRITLFTILAAWLLVPSSSAQVNQPKAEGDKQAEEELKNLTRSWDEAMVKKDVKTLDAILADEYSMSQIPKAPLIALITNQSITYSSYKREVVRIQTYGDTAISMSRTKLTGNYPGTSFSSEFNSMDVWIRKDGRWRCVATMTDQIKDANDKKDEKMVRFGPDVKYSFVVYFNKGVTNAQVESFLAEKISEERTDQRGHSFRKGICEYLRLGALQGHEAFAIRICDGTADLERKEIESKIRASAIIYKVLKDTVPAEVKK